MTIKNIFILSKYAMFGSGLKSLLGQDTTLNVIQHEADLETALDQIKQLQPDVIILDGGEIFSNFTLGALRTLQESSMARIIGLNLKNNWLKVYNTVSTTTWPVEDVHDLIRAITHDFSPVLSTTGRLEKQDQFDRKWLFLKRTVSINTEF